MWLFVKFMSNYGLHLEIVKDTLNSGKPQMCKSTMNSYPQ